MPDALCVLLDATVGGKVTRCGHVEQRHAIPLLLVGVIADHIAVRAAVGFEIGKAQIGVCNAALARQQIRCEICKALTGKADIELRYDARKIFVVGVELGRAVAA